ncbi:hypothetical protein JIG36_45620 [Actinoplanes sp. LDG1-06]|uniref:Uncharacterized protein n=1 Tax=Paractinoplanes ovalisporus TaxID=2810368 RepID=A0ABS2AUE8_9ACTN|nr:hypothetical protein [Actinoplanes ovalisporus]MBM2622804.1 hypothetical protein [Actinoplanes ovalisporus]
MAKPVASLAEVPLDALLPDHRAVLGELRRLGARLEAHPAAAGRTGWLWLSENVERPDPEDDLYRLVLGGSVMLFSTGVDWLSAGLDVAWCPRLAVRASVEVACWCPVNHNAHDVQEGYWAVGTDDTLVEGFGDAVTMLLRFLDSGRDDPEALRAAAGLPLEGHPEQGSRRE